MITAERCCGRWPERSPVFLRLNKATNSAIQCAALHGDNDGEGTTVRHNGHHDAQAAIETA